MDRKREEFIKRHKLNDTPQIERKGYKVNDLFFMAKSKKGLADLITFVESVYHPSENEYISLLDKYIINAEHCISSLRSFNTR